MEAQAQLLGPRMRRHEFHLSVFDGRGTGPFRQTERPAIPAREAGLRVREASYQLFFTTSTMPCTDCALFASMPFSSSVSGIWTIFSTPPPPMMTGTPMKRSL